MPNFERGDIVRVPFPYTDRETRQYRPALVVSIGGLGETESLLWVVMITSAKNRPWPGDVSLGDDYAEFGLPAPSVIRPTKIATIEIRQADRIGRLDQPRLAKVEEALGRQLGLRLVREAGGA
jgi:mRNA interferase MazF